MPTELMPMTLSGLCYAVGYLIGVAAFYWIARRRGMATFGVTILAYVALIGGLIGANIGQWLFSGAPGKSVLGGIVGGWLFVLAGRKCLGLRRPTGDLFAFGLSAGESVGRLGCFFGGCCFGKPASGLPWLVEQHGEMRHPTQVYLALAAALIFAILLALELRGDLPENGLFFVQGALATLFRFVIEFFRDSPSMSGLPISAAQVVCLLLFGLFASLLTRQVRRRNEVAPVERNRRIVTS